MTGLLQEIQDNLNRGFTGKAMRITCLPEEYPAWTVKQVDWIGVVVPMPEFVEFSEDFANAHVNSRRGIQLADKVMDALFLTCDDIKLRNSFATICEQFVDPGEDGSNRKKLVANPEEWWKEWMELLGNKSTSRETYSTIGELLVLECLLKKGQDAKWGGPGGAVHDIECPDQSFEVKSTVQRYGYNVEISSAYQMDPGGRPLSLAFCRFEPSDAGRSLNEVVDDIAALGYSADLIEKELKHKGFEKGKTARKIRYKLLEMKVFPVDDAFPSITKESFVGGMIPQRIEKLKYEVNLNGLECRNEP